MARQVRLYYFSNWAEEIEDALAFLHRAQDVSARVSDPQNSELVRMAQLDRDWDAASLSAGRRRKCLTHTDRVFWAGCAGQVPVVEDSKWGGRLDDLAAGALIFRYAHGDLKGMIDGCEAALEAPLRQRERIDQHFNAHETIGTVVEGVIAQHQRASSG